MKRLASRDDLVPRLASPTSPRARVGLQDATDLETGGLDTRLGARIPVGDLEYDFGVLGALGSFAVETLPRCSVKHGAVVAAPSRSDRGSS
jgi:hypothetical protein